MYVNLDNADNFWGRDETVNWLFEYFSENKKGLIIWIQINGFKKKKYKLIKYKATSFSLVAIVYIKALIYDN